MKRIKYIFLPPDIIKEYEGKPILDRYFINKDFRYTENALLAAQKEAYNGEYEIYDDGLPESEPEQSTDTISVWDELDSAYREGVDSV